MKITSLAAVAFTLATAAPVIAQPLSRVDIQRGVQAVRPAVDDCLRRAGVSTAVVRLDIVDGRVSAAEVRDGGGASACVGRAVKKARFRRSLQRITVSYPFLTRHAPAPSSRGPSLSREQISIGIRSIRAAVNRCRRSSAPALVTVRIQIANGRVASARGQSDAADPATIACVERAVARASFARAAPITVQYPFLLH